MVNKNIENLKKDYENIEIPNELDGVIKKAIEKGKCEMKNNNKKTKWINKVAATAAVFTAFTISVNTIPVFASSMSQVPGIGSLVKILQFNKGTASGGEITDGANVKSIDIDKNKVSETITIGVENDNIDANTMPHFKVDYKDYPSTMTFTISGVRSFSADKYLDSLKENKFVSNVYKVVTFDDSMVRFDVVFNTPVKYEVKEYKNPAKVVVTLTEDEEKKVDKPKYSVRTASYQGGEQIGIMEEQIGADNARIIKDEKGTFLIEAGIFDSEEEANKKSKELKNNFDFKLYVEKRNTMDIPKAINQ